MSEPQFDGDRVDGSGVFALPATGDVRWWWVQGSTFTTEDAEAQFDAWLAGVSREAKAEAWDEGFRAGWGTPLLAPILGNPYREGTK